MQHLEKRTEKFAYLKTPTDKSISEQIEMFRDYIVTSVKLPKENQSTLHGHLLDQLTHGDMKSIVEEYRLKTSGLLANREKTLTNALIGMYTASVKTCTIVPNQAERLVQNPIAAQAIRKEAKDLLNGVKSHVVTLLTHENKNLRSSFYEAIEQNKELLKEREQLNRDNNMLKRAYENIIGNLRGVHKFTDQQIKSLHTDRSKDQSQNIHIQV